MSVDYYTRFERGNLAGASDSVLEALGRALQLDEAEREHLADLARAANASFHPRARRRGTKGGVPPSVQRILDAMIGVPAFVRNGRLDILAINQLGEALYSEAFAEPARPVNLARFAFLDPRSRNLYPDWEKAADTSVALLHTEAGRDPYARTDGPRRRALNAQPRLPPTLGAARGAPSPHRDQGVPPPGRSATCACRSTPSSCPPSLVSP